jgi:hypothetical protein
LESRSESGSEPGAELAKEASQKRAGRRAATGGRVALELDDEQALFPESTYLRMAASTASQLVTVETFWSA